MSYECPRCDYSNDVKDDAEWIKIWSEHLDKCKTLLSIGE